MELEFPIEFIVSGTPVSFQANRARAKEAWKERVQQAFLGTLSDPHFYNEMDEMSVAIRYFTAASRDGKSPDIDNIFRCIKQKSV